jgi:hypothetical protein
MVGWGWGGKEGGFTSLTASVLGRAWRISVCSVWWDVWRVGRGVFGGQRWEEREGRGGEGMGGLTSTAASSTLSESDAAGAPRALEARSKARTALSNLARCSLRAAQRVKSR